MAKVVYALSDTWLGTVYVRRGEPWAADDPVVLGNPAAFAEDAERAGVLRRSGPSQAPVVEQATAEPGERRNIPRPPRGRS